MVGSTGFEYQFETMVYFAGQYNLPRNVLGLNGWFDRFRFALIHHDETLYLSSYDD